MQAPGIDWRFADPAAVRWPVSIPLLSQHRRWPQGSSISWRQAGLTEVDVRQIFERLAGVDDLAISIRDNKILVMLADRVSGFTLPKRRRRCKSCTGLRQCYAGR